jgi:hypothetical protein
MARRLLDRNRARESRRQVRLLDRLTRQFRGRIERELIAAMSDMVERWELTREVMMPRGFAERLEATYRQMTLAAVSAFGGRILEQGKAAGLVLERKEDFSQTMNRLALQYVQQEAIRRRIQGVTETTRRQIIGAVDRGYQDGVGTAEIARNVRGVVAWLARFRAEAIARTETHGAANFGSDSAAKLTGLPLRREWLAAQDERTRETHAAADGQIVGPEDAFTVGSSSLMYPGDPSAPPEETVNCRCVLGYIVDDGIDDWVDPAGEPGAGPGLVEVPSPPAPLFAYETAPMPNTAAEAAKFIADYGIAAASRLEGFKIATLHSSLRAALEVKERFDLAPLAGIGPATRFGMRQVKGANAAVFPVQRLLHLPTKFGVLSEYQRQNAVAIKTAGRYETAMRANLIKFAARHDPEVAKRAERLTPGSYGWTISSMGNPAEQARIITYHEYGHVLHLIDKKIGAEINNFLDNYTPRLKGWANLLSEYASTNDKEYVAEAFSIYMIGNKSEFYRIHPKLLTIFEKLDRKK